MPLWPAFGLDFTSQSTMCFTTVSVISQVVYLIDGFMSCVLFLLFSFQGLSGTHFIDIHNSYFLFLNHFSKVFSRPV